MKALVITVGLLVGVLFFLGNSQSNPGEIPLKVSEIKAADTIIAAGGVDTPYHSTEIEIKLNYPLSCNVTLWLKDGEGYGTGDYTWTHEGVNYSASLEGPALLNGKKPGEPLVVRTNSLGIATVTLRSSNKVESVRIQGRVGSHANCSSPDTEDVVQFYGFTSVVTMAPLRLDTWSRITLDRTCDEGPLAGHDVVLYVKSVVLDGQTINFNPLDPTALNQYAEIPQSLIRQTTDANGQVESEIHIKNIPGLESVYVESRDFNTFD